VDAKSGTRCRQRHDEASHDQQVHERRPTANNHGHCYRKRDRSDDQPNDTVDPPPKQAVPTRHTGDQHTAHQNQATRELAYRDRDRQRKRGRAHHQREKRSQSPSHSQGSS
jgi:hypothetical protein